MFPSLPTRGLENASKKIGLNILILLFSFKHKATTYIEND
jgi:hypothetical protein